MPRVLSSGHQERRIEELYAPYVPTVTAITKRPDYYSKGGRYNFILREPALSGSLPPWVTPSCPICGATSANIGPFRYLVLSSVFTSYRSRFDLMIEVPSVPVALVG